MPYTIGDDEARRLVVVAVRGADEAKTVAAMVAEARERSASRGWNILYDVRDALPDGVSSAELFWMPRKLDALRRPEARRTRVALLHLARHAELARFWEATFTNVGLQARAFEDEAAALDWLAA